MGISPLSGIIDSIVGIITGTVYGVAPQVLAFLASLGVVPPV